MRGIPLFAATVAALALAGCMQRQASIIDPATGQPVPVVQHYQPQSVPGYQPPQTAESSRNLYASSAAAAQQGYATPADRAAMAPQARGAAPAKGADRGLFTGSTRMAWAPPHRAPAYREDVQPADASSVAPPPYAAPQYATAAPAPATQSYAYAAPASAQQPYTLDSGDKLRIVVFGQDGLTNSYIVGADGSINLPLIGVVPARGLTTQQLSRVVADRLKHGFVREPHVSVEVETYRPFFILGEVTTPGQYPYVANMTAETAVAIAGGFSPRAYKGKIEVTRNIQGQAIKSEVPLSYPIRPGDTVMVKERWF